MNTATLQNNVQPVRVLSFTDQIGFLVSISLVFCISLWLSPYYVDGDQYHYIRIYEAMANKPFLEAATFYFREFSFTPEATHFFFSWLLAYAGLPKFLAMSLVNALMAGVLAKILLDRRVHPFIVVLFITTNFYLYVLYFAGERLKFGFIFLFLAVLVSQQRPLLSKGFAVVSIFSHLQMAIVCAALMLKNLDLRVRYRDLFFIKKDRFKATLLVVLLVIALLVVGGNYLFWKLAQYLGKHGIGVIFDFVQLAVFYVGLIYFCPSKKRVATALFLPLLMAVMVVGGDRVIIFAYMVFIFYVLQVNRGFNAGVLVTSLYFGFKGLAFVLEVLAMGKAFSGQFSVF